MIKAVIMAGGKGTRVASVAPGIPKPMIPVNGKPVLEHQVESLKKNSISEIIIVTGHLGHTIKDYFSDGKKYNCNISYYEEDTPLGSAGALFKIQERLDDDFLLVNGDIIFDIDLSRFVEFHRGRAALATLAVHPNSHPFDSALLETDSESRVVSWLNKEDPRKYYRNQVNSGLHILSKKLLEGASFPDEKVDLDRDILKPGVSTGKIFAYRTPEYIKDMGTPERYRQVEKDMKSGLVQKKNLANRQRAMFIDRDGTITTLDGFVTRPEQLVLADGAAAAVRMINESGFLAIVITNQPVIARGECTVEELDEIHRKMETDLGFSGAYIDDIFYCPHHPDKGFAGERPEYKIECECRKPEPGMLLAAAKKYNIDLSESYMAGDSNKDALAGLRAGCRPALIRAGRQHSAETVDDREAPVFGSLYDFVEQTLRAYGSADLCG
ncbi:MAG: HAD-IIIA family hydrolase [Spirochaetaceae bacterium]|nr:HAD-IIIA family hydrolase [Spirochaetaceae bacterium]